MKFGYYCFLNAFENLVNLLFCAYRMLSILINENIVMSKSSTCMLSNTFRPLVLGRLLLVIEILFSMSSLILGEKTFFSLLITVMLL